MSPIAVVALGGNALVTDAAHQAIADQYDAVCSVAGPLVELVQQGWGLVVSHGNGPQVGFILRRSELAEAEVAPVPMDYAVGDTQGAIGYMFLKAIGNELRRRGVDRRVAALVTQTVVDAADPAFAHPTKPIGSFLDSRTAHEQAQRLGWQVAEDAGRGWRRVVPSPAPVEIVELETIRSLLEAGTIVVAGGGGGIPVVRDADGDLAGVEAVVDKDSACALMAAELGADLFAIPTGVDRVALNFGQPDQRWIDRLTVVEATTLASSGELAEGSMRPKVQALVTYLKRRPGGAGVITSAQMLPAALRRETGTWIEG
ncbi:MAG: carbamate kinase [Actinobacteria bacterium]|nr:carbamate kinase [Actinomycetota bacterium]